MLKGEILCHSMIGSVLFLLCSANLPRTNHWTKLGKGANWIGKPLDRTQFNPFSTKSFRNIFLLSSKKMKVNLKLTMTKQNKSWACQHGTDPWPTPKCLDIFPTPQHLQNMPFIAYGDARPLAGLGHVCSRLFSEMMTTWVTLQQGGHMTMARLTSGQW